MTKKFLAEVKDKHGFKYIIYTLSKEDAESFVSMHHGKLLEAYSRPKKGHYYYLLDNNYVVGIFEWDATAYDSYQGFLSNLESSGYSIRKRIPKDLPIKRIILLPDFTKIVYYEIKLPESGIPEDLEEIIEARNNKKNYKIKNGKIIQTYKDNKSGMQFESLEDFNRYSDFIALQNPFSLPGPVCGLNPYGQNFPDHVDELIQILPELINIPASKLDYTVYSMPRLDKYLYQNLIEHEFIYKIFMPLLAYIGQTWIRLNGGNWIMSYDKKFDTWTPDLLDEDGKPKKMAKQLDLVLSPWEEETLPLATVFNAKGANFYYTSLQ